MFNIFITEFHFFFNNTATTEIYTLSLHDALPISLRFFLNPGVTWLWIGGAIMALGGVFALWRSEEHTSELQSRFDLVCRLLLEKKNYSFARTETLYRLKNQNRPKAGSHLSF